MASVDALLQQGIAAAKAGNRDLARRCLMEVTERDEENERAWLWLSEVVDSWEDKAVCLENVLAIHPGHQAAQMGLTAIRERLAEVEPSSPEPAPAREMLCPECGQANHDFATECWQCGHAFFQRCPHCYQFVEGEAEQCPYCQKSLLEPEEDEAAPAPVEEMAVFVPTVAGEEEMDRVRVRERPSMTLINTLVLWNALAIYAGVATALVVFALREPAGLPYALLSRLTATLTEEDFRVAAIGCLVPLAPMTLIGLAMTVGLHLRWGWAFYGSVGMSVIGLGLGVYYLTLGTLGGNVAGGIFIVLFFLIGLLTLLSGEDFEYKEMKRPPVRQTKYSLAQTYYNRGVAYARQGQLEKAIEEWHRVIALTPYDVLCRNALAIAYEEHGQPDLAWQQLEKALEYAPRDARTLANRQHLRRTYGYGGFC